MNMKKKKDHIVTSFLNWQHRSVYRSRFCIYTLILSSWIGTYQLANCYNNFTRCGINVSVQPLHCRESAFSGYFCINTKRLSFTLHLLLDKSDEGMAKKTIHWTEYWCSSKRSRLNTSTVFHFPESRIKRDIDQKKRGRKTEK